MFSTDKQKLSIWRYAQHARVHTLTRLGERPCRNVADNLLFWRCYSRDVLTKNEVESISWWSNSAGTAATPAFRASGYCAATARVAARRNSGLSLRPDRKALMLRVAWRRRWRFSTRAMRTN